MPRPNSLRVNACLEKGVGTRMQAHGNTFTAVSSRLQQPTVSAGWLQ